jgi:cystathionine beta-synthase
MARRIAKEEGLFCGYSAGSCLQGLMQLKDKLKKEDMVVCLLHDHGSRYVAKIYNDQWMLERGFLEVKTFKDIVSSRGAKKLITITADKNVMDAFDLMQKYNIENLPVMQNGQITGAVSESGLFNKMMKDGQDIKFRKIYEVQETSYPTVANETPLERLSSLISKENGAVLAKDDTGDYHIVTKYDVIQALGS